MIFFFKQKTAYEMRISDWSSDVCSSDLESGLRREEPRHGSCHPGIREPIWTLTAFERRSRRMCSHPRSTREGAMETDLEFYTRRAREEREAADTAVSSEARESHQELASRYDRMMRAGTAKVQTLKPVFGKTPDRKSTLLNSS